MTLQLGRAFGPLCAVVEAGFSGDASRVKSHARMIAEAILFGARDRSRDKPLRTLYDLQKRVEPLRQARPPRNRPKKKPSPPRSAGEDAA